MNYVICKEECGSMNTTFYKDHKYKYEYHNSATVKIYNEIGIYVFFFGGDFKEFFITEKELRKEKLKKLNNL